MRRMLPLRPLVVAAQRVSSASLSVALDQYHNRADRVFSLPGSDCDDVNCHQHAASCSSGGRSPIIYSIAPSGSVTGSVNAGCGR
jgi:hypothetical protein